MVEFGGIGPGPFGAMILADMGADIVRIDPPSFDGMDVNNALLRGRSRVTLDLKVPQQLDIARDLISKADVVIEGFRPGVMERLGLSPDDCLAGNSALIYARMTGWGQDGPLSNSPGHDINYLALSGILDTIGRSGQAPLAPLNYVADYGGGGMLLAVGVLGAIIERSHSGKGQVIDVAMIDGVALMLADVLSRYQSGQWHPERGTNLYDSGAPFYEVYETADHAFIAVGAIERKFYSMLLTRLGFDNLDPNDQEDRSGWSSLRSRLEETFRTRTQSEWCAVFADAEACITPVLPFTKAANDPHIKMRQTFLTINGRSQPAPAPRFSRSASTARASISEDPADVIKRWS